MTPQSTLDTSERGRKRRAAQIFVVLFILGWLAVLAGDWYFRFARYEWDKHVIARPPRASVVSDERPSFRTNVVHAYRGGDLTRTIAIGSVAERFEEDRSGGLRIVDASGYMNYPYDPSVTPDMVVVGDSFMAVGTLDDLFSTRLMRVSDRFVYNHALMGHGPFLSVQRFWDDDRFRDHPPRVLVWGFAEREMAGAFLDRFAYRIRSREERMAEQEDAPGVTPPAVRIRWQSLLPERLKTALPNTSILAQAGEWLWNRARYYLFHQITPEVVMSPKPVAGGPMLFYRYHIETLGWGEEVRRPLLAAKSIEEFDSLCRARGMHLVVLLIPEKEQVYRDALPVRFNPPDNPLPPSVIWELERELKERDIRVVNMLGAFRDAAARDELVYWRDDTHWNPHGVQMAVERVWDEVSALFAQEEFPQAVVE